MSKKKNKNIKIKKYFRNNVIPALVFAGFITLLSLCAWRDISVYREYQDHNVTTITRKCVSVTKTQTNEPRKHGAFTIYSIRLEDGTEVAIYKDVADELFHSNRVPAQKQALEEKLVTGQPITVTYVRNPTLVRNIYALVCASAADGEILIPAPAAIYHYASRVKAITIVCSIFYGISCLILIAPLIFRLLQAWGRHRKRLKKQREKARKKQKTFQAAPYRECEKREAKKRRRKKRK
ncbi:MAG: hypothetical protein SOX74_01360 [Candidatus Faecousia sp.]|uniref:hypothetical protein n=1 Tax=Faecousia sp. TaxID=2952921 RepID=UPI002A8B93C8|nr:hypothetical protein [Candidatus Faecousia sp.]